MNPNHDTASFSREFVLLDKLNTQVQALLQRVPQILIGWYISRFAFINSFLVYIYRLYNIVTISINFILNGTQYKNLKDSLFTE